MKQSDYDSDYFDGYTDGYLSGMLDGEGSIGLYHVKTKRHGEWYYFWRPNVGIGNNCYAALELVKEICGGGHIAHNGRNSYVYTMNPFAIRKVIPRLVLVVKAEHKKLILEALGMLGRHRKHTWQEQIRLEEISLELKKLNSGKGKSVYKPLTES